MEPLKPDIVRNLLNPATPAAAPVLEEEVEEYEQLLSERFTRDPDLPMSPLEADAVDQAEDRIEQLHQKLFGNPGRPPSGATANP